MPGNWRAWAAVSSPIDGTAGAVMLQLLPPSAGTALRRVAPQGPWVTEPFLMVVTCSPVPLELPSVLAAHFITSPSHLLWNYLPNTPATLTC